MSELGQALLKLAEEHGQSKREHKERWSRQLKRLTTKLSESRQKFGARLQKLADQLNASSKSKGITSLLKPWRGYSDRRQLALVELLLKQHQAESSEILRTLELLSDTDPATASAKQTD